MCLSRSAILPKVLSKALRHVKPVASELQPQAKTTENSIESSQSQPTEKPSSSQPMEQPAPEKRSEVIIHLTGNCTVNRKVTPIKTKQKATAKRRLQGLI